MSLFINTYWLKRFGILVSFIIVTLILWNTYSFFKLFKEEERAKMEVYASAIKELAENTDLNANINLENKVFETIKNIPAISIDEHGAIKYTYNLDSIKSKDPKYLKDQLNLMKRQNDPIIIEYLNTKDYIYYRNSDLLYKLTYYPIALLLILALFSTIIYLVYRSNKVAEQNKLWTGMAKETAHQIGTPLSSLLGWIEILKTENIDPSYINEMQKDVDRLSTIANRFSKIGSLPELKKQDIVSVAETTFNYLQSRGSKHTKFSFKSNNTSSYTELNTELFGWVIENLIKNAIDAMQGKGSVAVEVIDTVKRVKILVSDTGKGIAKSQFNQIFKPGFTTKKRGWGLGLSLSKRIIEDYHNGKIHVLKSELGKGTTFEIILQKT